MIIDKYNKRAKEINSLLCVGLDPDFEKLPEKFKTLPHPQFEFNKYIIGETHEFAAAYKPNMGSYEVRGAKGWEDLEMTMDYLRKNYPDIFTICDAKRADIGYTNELYAKAIFDTLGFDAVTLHPYLGQEALKPFLDRKDKVSIILCRTSNPGAGELQDLITTPEARPLWWVVAEKVSKEWNKNSNCMLVVGATYPAELGEVRKIVGDLTILVPGIGTQGGSVKEVMEAGLSSEKLGLIVSSSKAIIFSENLKEEARKLCEEIRSNL
ncbi:orotidine 5'-phosphate decarboxylase [Candidatus Nomurabacteria bacterium RIFCSPHIGHO2_02_FULL_42_19]|uniref:Orotidine-5'-phosphate decarboxylase n=1 Tax=Candidatus Nomurabacteria bacterium RIFCSPHIGHO2_02_FULL_42_19 TaxID=1801756 RepID=A0A1F6W1X3_9BACT|nr:MAG: orotidine 5'-phosphate decarboxylase [Candidatus Nomurabacteria bacterium RIFCSPHIGHO2_02_FULL_42_19]